MVTAAQAPPDAAEAVRALVGRFDPSVLPGPPKPARVRLQAGDAAWDVVLAAGKGAELRRAGGGRPETVISASPEVWGHLLDDPSAGLDHHADGRLRVRGNLHLGVGLLAATTPRSDDRRLRFGQAAGLSTMEAGSGAPVLFLHGLGATKASFLPSVVAMAETHRAIALDLPGFGDSEKPLLGRYHAPFFAERVLRAMDELGIERADVVGNSMGGRVALELGFRVPERVRRLALLCPSLAWLRDRPWAAPLRLVRPELGAIQPAPRAVVETIARRLVPGADDGWTAAGVDEWLRAYLTPRGRVAFYAAARNIYLEDPDKFYDRLGQLRAPSLFVWGRHDTLVPPKFGRHVRRVLPRARHLVLDCGHVPQFERPAQTHRAIRAHLRG